MDSLVITEQISPLVAEDTFSAISLLESGLNCFRQGCYTEGTEFLTLARAQLPPNQVQLTAALNALNQANATHVHAQQALHEASKRFAESDSEQQAKIAALQKLLAALIEQTDCPSQARIQTRRKNAKDRQPLRLLRSPWTSTEEGRLSRTAEDGNPLPALYITCFGRFEVRRFDSTSHPISLCTNLKGQAILRYLITRPKYRETADILMDELWPEEAPEAAQRKLRVAASALRCSLNKDFISEAGAGYILCKGQGYQLNPAVEIQTDVDEFLALYQAGREGSGNTATLYEKACLLYTGPFLGENLYAEWSFIRREEVSKTYVVMCDWLAEYNLANGCYENAVNWASAILKVDRCDEEAHKQLMQAYTAQGRRSEALRQYQRCQRVLCEELGVQPVAETQKLIQMLMNGEDFSTIERNR